MVNPMARHAESRIEAALREISADLVAEGVGLWRGMLANGSRVPMRARLLRGWLELTASVPEPLRDEQDDVSWLRLNARFPGSIRAARALTAHAAQLRTDLWWDDDAGAVFAACVALQEAVHATAGMETSEASPPRAASETVAGEVETLCNSELGWPCRRLPGGALRLDFSTTEETYGARLECIAGSDCLVVDLREINGQPEVTSSATARLLMALSATVRLVKPLIVERENQQVAALSAPIGLRTSADVERSVSALAVACQIAGGAVDALRDESVALRYLELAGSSTNKEGVTCRSHP
jgi:hypothetical protein